MLTKKSSRLAREILGLIGIAGIISVFFYGFLEFATKAVVEIYCEKSNLILNDIQWEYMQYWLQRVSLITSVVMFLLLYLFLTGQKLIYIKQIIQGVDALQERDMDFQVPVEGEDELAQLAERINYLAKSQRQLREKEEALKQEKDVFIRTLSHDIRTPLTSVLAMSEYLEEKETLSEADMKEYISLVKNKSAQMKILTDRLLNEGQRKPEFFKNGKLLFEQLAEEWKELLEDEFECHVDIGECENFQGEFDLAELRRIFDNLASNIQKYADALKRVELKIFTKDQFVIIEQKNSVPEKREEIIESYGIGLQSIERLAKIYRGNMEAYKDEMEFAIVVKLEMQMSDDCKEKTS